MFGTAFGSFLEPKDSFDSQACWTIHQRREGQTFVESSHFVLRKKKKKQQQLQAAVEAVKESPKLYNSTAGIYGGDTQEKHNRPINTGEVDSSNAGLFHLEEWQPRFRKVLLRMPPRTQSERGLKESFGMHEVWLAQQIVTRGVLSLRLALTLMPCQRLMNVQPQQLKATQGRTDCRLDFRLSCGRFKWMHSKFHEVFRYFV